jgi:hypothetical protein
MDTDHQEVSGESDQSAQQSDEIPSLECFSGWPIPDCEYPKLLGCIYP